MFSKENLRNLVLPLLLEQALIVAVGMMDTVMVSSCGESAVSGVSLVDSINVLIIQVFSALATGGTVVCSQYLGKKDLSSGQRAAHQLFFVVLSSSLLCMIPSLFFRRTILEIVFGEIESDVMASSQSYFLMTALSFPFLSMYNAGAALLRSMGRSSATLKISAVSNVINILGNAITIYLLNMGAAGAGLATLISRIAASVLVYFPLRRGHGPLHYPDLRRFAHDPALNRKILAVALPSGLENGLFQFGKLILVRLIATFGTASIAANAVGNTLATIQCLPGMALSLAMITVVGQCVGAGAYDQARSYSWRLMKLTYMIQGSLNIVMLLMNGFICMPFHLTPETEILARQVVALHGSGALLIWPLSFVLPNALRAAGDARFTMTVSAISMMLCRVVLGYVFASNLGLGLIGVWIAMQVDWVIRIVAFLIRFHGNTWKTKALV